MWRYQAVCRHCGFVSSWQGDREGCREDIRLHLQTEHDPTRGGAAAYELREQRQCDYCLGAYLDHCTKCGRDFCRWHEGDIDGLCGGCI